MTHWWVEAGVGVELVQGETISVVYGGGFSSDSNSHTIRAALKFNY